MPSFLIVVDDAGATALSTACHGNSQLSHTAGASDHYADAGPLGKCVVQPGFLIAPENIARVTVERRKPHDRQKRLYRCGERYGTWYYTQRD